MTAMQKTKRILLIALLMILAPHITANAQDKPLFPQPLFSDYTMDQQLDADMLAAAEAGANVAAKPITNSAIDDEMRREMRKVARYLQLYGIRNGARFPGFQNDEMEAARVQLTQLVPNNPYSFNSQVFAEPWSEDQGSQQLDRIRLQMNQ